MSAREACSEDASVSMSIVPCHYTTVYTLLKFEVVFQGTSWSFRDHSVSIFSVANITQLRPYIIGVFVQTFRV